MKKEQNRALDAFAAMESLPDDLVLDAERALTEAENGFSLTPSKAENPFVRFLNSGWGVAAIAGLVSVVVLVILIRMGKEPPTYDPPVKPAGSTIEMSTEGADFTLSMEPGSYDVGASRITVIMTGKTPGASISMHNAWHLERLTEEGAEIVHIYYTEEAIETVRPDKDGYATIKKTIHIDRTPLTAGTYRLHATKHDGEKYVSVAYCTFTVGDPGSLTWDSDTLAPTEPETDPSAEYSPAIDRPYTISVTDTITMGGTPVLGPKRLDVTIKAVEPGVTLMLSTNYRIVKLAGSPNGENAGWLALALETEVYPTEENQGYAVHQDAITFIYPGEWLPGLYRLYALNHDEEYIDYCDFVITGDHSMSMELFLKETRYTTQSTMLEIQILGHQRGEPASWYEGWSLYAVQGESRTLMGACSPIEIAYEAPAPDENAFSLIDIDQSISHVTGGKYTTLPAGDYELVFGSGSHTQVMPFTVVGETEAVDRYGFYEGGEVLIGVYKYSPDFPEGDHGFEKIAADYIYPDGSSKFISGLSGDTIEDTQAPATLKLAATDSFVGKTLYHQQSYQDKSGLYRLYADDSGYDTYLFDEDGRFIEYDMPADGISPFEDDGLAIRVACDFLLSVGVEITDAYTCTVLPVGEQNVFLHSDPKGSRSTVLITRNIGGMMGEGYVVYCGGSGGEPCVIYSQAVNPGMYEAFGYVTAEQIGHTRKQLHEAIGLLECYVGATYRVTYEVAPYDREYLVMSGNHLYLCVEFSPIITDPDYTGIAGGGTCSMRITP